MRTMSGGPCLHYDCANRTSFGYCKTSACIIPKYSNIGTAQYGQGVQKRIVTNADHIRNMSNEELAEFIGGDPMHDICPNNCHDDLDRPCKVCALDWLREEAK